MSELVLKTDIVREDGFLYFVKNVNGKLGIFKAQMRHGKKKKEAKK